MLTVLKTAYRIDGYLINMGNKKGGEIIPKAILNYHVIKYDGVSDGVLLLIKKYYVIF